MRKRESLYNNIPNYSVDDAQKGCSLAVLCRRGQPLFSGGGKQHGGWWVYLRNSISFTVSKSALKMILSSIL